MFNFVFLRRPTTQMRAFCNLEPRERGGLNVKKFNCLSVAAENKTMESHNVFNTFYAIKPHCVY